MQTHWHRVLWCPTKSETNCCQEALIERASGAAHPDCVDEIFSGELHPVRQIGLGAFEKSNAISGWLNLAFLRCLWF